MSATIQGTKQSLSNISRQNPLRTPSTAIGLVSYWAVLIVVYICFHMLMLLRGVAWRAVPVGLFFATVLLVLIMVIIKIPKRAAAHAALEAGRQIDKA